MISECLTINNHEYTFVTFYVTQSLKGFFKIVNFEDFHNFHGIFPNGGHKLAFLLL